MYGFSRTILREHPKLVGNQPETRQQHTDWNKTGITPMLLVLEVQDAP
jgi:hypothetical protein